MDAIQTAEYARALLSAPRLLLMDEPLANLDARLKAEGLAALAAVLTARDPATAATTDLQNPMRVTRALEVLEATGRGLAAWRAETPPPLVKECERALIAPDREQLYARCDARFDAMLKAGALEEAAAMAARGLNPALPAMKAVGAPELACDLVDMEAFALARACERAGVAFRCIKFVSDAADHGAADDWQANKAKGAALFADWLAKVTEEAG